MKKTLIHVLLEGFMNPGQSLNLLHYVILDMSQEIMLPFSLQMILHW